MAAPLTFQIQLTLTELLGRRARSAAELRDGIRSVPRSSIYYHTHRYLLQHVRESPEPPNDFAYWTTNSLGRHQLGESLASVNTVDFLGLEELRDRFVSILEAQPSSNDGVCVLSPEGLEFHFLACRIFVVPAGLTVCNLPEFRDALTRIPAESLYYHMFVPRFLGAGAPDDFSRWFGAQGRTDVAAALAKLDPYAMTVEGLRRKILDILDQHA